MLSQRYIWTGELYIRGSISLRAHLKSYKRVLSHVLNFPFSLSSCSFSWQKVLEGGKRWLGQPP